MHRLRFRNRRRLAIAFAVFVALATAGMVSVAHAIDSEGESFVRARLIGNLGTSHADIGVFPDRGPNAAPDRSGGATKIEIPAGADLVDSVVYWVGRGPGWTDPSITVNGVAISADIHYDWRTPDYDQITYAADLDAAGVVLGPGTTELTFAGLDGAGHRFYGAGVVAVYEHPSLPEVELELLEGNEFAFYLHTYSDAIGHTGVHTEVACSSFPPAIEDRSLDTFIRIMGVDAGRGDGPPRTQRYQWWTGTGEVVAPISDGLVGVPAAPPDASIDNPVTPKVEPTARWGSVTFTADSPTLGAGETTFCNQVLSVDIGDGKGASLGIANRGAAATTVHRVGNLVWADLDDDGTAEAGEPGIAGVAVELWRDGGTEPIAETVTGDDGAYLFGGLACGSYRLRVPGGQTGQRVGDALVDLSGLTVSATASADPDDDLDNDSNGIVGDGAASSGIVTLGDCGEDGDFSDGASAEPTNETDRVDGPDDDPDDVDRAAGNYDDVRSNVTVDFAFVACTPGGPLAPGDASCPEPTDPGDDGDGDGTSDGTTRDPDEDGDGTADGTSDDVIPEVEGEQEENPDQGDSSTSTQQDEELAATGPGNVGLGLLGLVIIVVGLWFATAASLTRRYP